MNKNKLKFKYHSPRNDRIKNNGRNGITTRPGILGYFYMFKTKRWELHGSEGFEAGREQGYCSHQNCNSFRRFKRTLRKQPEMIGKLMYVTRFFSRDDNYDYDIESIL